MIFATYQRIRAKGASWAGTIHICGYELTRRKDQQENLDQILLEG